MHTADSVAREHWQANVNELAGMYESWREDGNLPEMNRCDALMRSFSEWPEVKAQAAKVVREHRQVAHHPTWRD